MNDFLPWNGLAGGVLIGLSAAFFLLIRGRVSGISGIVENVLFPSSRAAAWSLAYLAGLPLGALAVALIAPGLAPKPMFQAAWPLLTVAGLLVGFGARVGGGCTSGHGVCGLPRLSLRSIVATVTFMVTAALTVLVVRHVI